jgi:hypothetical protein
MAGLPWEEAIYEIRVHGHLDGRWSEWFNGLALAYEPDGATVLTGPVADQAALYGLLERMRDLGLSLLAVNRVQATEPGDSLPAERPAL